MLKRLFVSSSSLLKVKTYTNKRCYWIPPESEEPSKVSFVKEKYDIPKEILELIESQEKELKNIRNELTNQKKVIEKIYNKFTSLQESIDKYASNSRALQFISLGYTVIILFKT
jgi:peptidoglycan hydrolase CwlO-like protein